MSVNSGLPWADYNALQNSLQQQNVYQQQNAYGGLANQPMQYPFGSQTMPPLSEEEQARIDEIHYRASMRFLAQRHGKMSLEDQEALRAKYPTLLAAWENYQIVLKMCLSEEGGA